MKKIMIVVAFLIACGKDPQVEQREKLSAKLDEMKSCLKYRDQDYCEKESGLHIFTDKQTKQMMVQDLDSGAYGLPTQGQNGQPQLQTFQQYPPPQVINNYAPPQHSNMDFFMGTMLGMTMMNMAHGGMGYAPPSYARGNTTINKTTIVKNYNRPYEPSRADRLKERRAYQTEQRQRTAQARQMRVERAQARAAKVDYGSGRPSSSYSSKSSGSSSRSSYSSGSSPRSSSSSSSSRSSGRR